MTETPLLSTTIYSIAPGRLFRAYLGRWLVGAWPLVVLPLLVCVWLSVWLGDLRWAIVALMVVFIVWPMVAVMIWMWYMLKPEAARFTGYRLKVTIYQDRSVEISYYRDEEQVRRERIEAGGIERMRPSAGGVMVTLRGGTLLWIPRRAIEVGAG